MRRLTLTNSNRYWTILAFVVAIALILTTFALFFAPKAYAARGEAWVTVDEIVLPQSTYGSVKFNTQTLDELYHYLTGGNSFSDVERAANANSTSATFRTNSGNNVSVYFGGMKWDAVYLTKATNGHIILDLWRSADEISSDSIKFSAWRSSDTSLTYPSNMYSTSYIRAIGLNAANSVYTTSSTGMSALFQYDYVQYAPFTVSGYNSVTGYSLTPFIAKPNEVGYQKDEWDEGTSTAMDSHGYRFPNDAFETPSGGQWYNSRYDYQTNDGDRTAAGAKYGAWQNDYLWLPSLTETGFNDSTGNGIWDTDAALRSGPGMQWLRSGEYDNAQEVYRLNSSGGYTKNFTNYVDSTGYMRPALHLDITEVEANAIDPPATGTYTFELPDEEVLFTADPSGVVKAEINITAHDIEIPNGYMLNLYVKSANAGADAGSNSDARFRVCMGSDYCNYTLSMTNSESYRDWISKDFYNDSYGLIIWKMHCSVETKVELDEIKLTLTLQNVPSVAGVWTDTLTFTALLEPID